MTASAIASLSRLTLEEAREALRLGRIIAFPTETFYGLGCDAMNADAVGGIFSLKKRSLALPLPVIVNSWDMLREITLHVTEATRALMQAFWPGPLSLVLPARPEVPELLTANAGRIAVRWSPHPAPLNLCGATGTVLVASSANISGRPSAARPEDLDPELVPGLAGIYSEGPEPAGGLPSTVVDLSEKPGGTTVRILRPGAVSAAALEAAGFKVLDTGF